MWWKDIRIEFTFGIVSDRFPPHQCFCGFFAESSSLPCGQESSFFFYSSSGYLPRDQNLQFRYHIHLNYPFHRLLHLIECLLNLVNHQVPYQLIVICLSGAHGVSDLENFEDYKNLWILFKEYQYITSNRFRKIKPFTFQKLRQIQRCNIICKKHKNQPTKFHN